MKEWNIRFEPDPGLDRIEVVVRGPSEDDGDVAELMKRLRAEQPAALTVYDGNGVVRRITAGEIVLISVVDKRVNVVTEDGSWFSRKPLQTLEEELDESSFLRISRYELVNLDKVTRYDFTVAGTLRLEFKGGMETWASRRCIPAIRKRLNGKE